MTTLTPTTLPPVTTLPPTTLPPTTLPPTTLPPTTLPPATIRAAQAFIATRIGAPMQMNTTIDNDAASPAAVSVTISLGSTSLPHYLQAVSAGGVLSCSNYFQNPPNPAVFTCTGTIPARSSNVVTVSSGSNIVATVGTSVSATVRVMPANVSAGASSTYQP